MSGELHGTIHLDQVKWFNIVSVLNTECVSNVIGSEKEWEKERLQEAEKGKE